MQRNSFSSSEFIGFGEVSDERQAEMLRQVLVVPEERLFVNPRNVAFRTESLDDSILLVEFCAGFRSGPEDVIPNVR